MPKKKYRRQVGGTDVAAHPAPPDDSTPAIAADGLISVEEARRMLGYAARFLHDSVKLAGKALVLLGLGKQLAAIGV